MEAREKEDENTFDKDLDIVEMLNETENLTILDALQSVTSFLYWLAAENGTMGPVDHRPLEADLGKRRWRIWTPSLLAQLVLQVPHLRVEVQQFCSVFFWERVWRGSIKAS